MRQMSAPPMPNRLLLALAVLAFGPGRFFKSAADQILGAMDDGFKIGCKVGQADMRRRIVDEVAKVHEVAAIAAHMVDVVDIEAPK